LIATNITSTKHHLMGTASSRRGNKLVKMRKVKGWPYAQRGHKRVCLIFGSSMKARERPRRVTPTSVSWCASHIWVHGKSLKGRNEWSRHCARETRTVFCWWQDVVTIAPANVFQTSFAVAKVAWNRSEQWESHAIHVARYVNETAALLHLL